MPSSDVSDIHNEISSIIHALKSPRDTSSLPALLTAPLKSIGLLPDAYDPNSISPLPIQVIIPKHIPLIQQALLESIAPSWKISYNHLLLEQCFCPTNVPRNVAPVTEVVLLAYSTIVSVPLTQFSVHLLQRLSVEYPIDTLFEAIFEQGILMRNELVWEDLVRNMLSIPSRVANAFGASIKGAIPSNLEQAFYINDICLRCERLVAYASCQSSEEISVRAITYLFTKLVNQGALPLAHPSARSQPSFFQTTLASIRRNLQSTNRNLYSSTWTAVLANIPSSLTLQKILQSMFASLQIDLRSSDRSRIQGNAQILQGFFGVVTPDYVRLWECTTGLLINKEWDEEMMRSIVCWISDALVDGKAIQALLDGVLNIWNSPLHIKLSSLSRHQYLTSLLLVATSYLPPASGFVQGIILSPAFLTAVGSYISHTERPVRLCGMLVAEILSSMGGKTLTFDVWEGNDEATLWAQRIRKLTGARTLDTGADARGSPTQHHVQLSSKTSTEEDPGFFATVDFDSDDSLTGYASPVSTRSISPELMEGEEEPYPNVFIKKVSVPTYLSQLIILLAGNGNDGDVTQAEKLEIALDSAENLIRSRKSFGTEMEENASLLASTLLGLQDKYNLPQFDIKRQAALNALVASCPHLAAPCLIEEFFKSQYSIGQRFAALEALACGGRELTLPRDTVLTLKRQARIQTTTTFTSISIANFISPLISRFWSFVRDEQTREYRTASYDGRNRHLGAGTGLILNPIVLAQFLRTLGILVHLSQKSPEWLMSVAPDSLEIAVTVCTLPVSCIEQETELGYLDSTTTGHLERKEIVILTAALELTLAVLDGCLEADNGEHLSLQYTALLHSTGDWAHAVFSRMNCGFIGDRGDLLESPLLRATTSVLLQIDRIASRWQRSMINLT